jgi:hypothetical protein
MLVSVGIRPAEPSILKEKAMRLIIATVSCALLLFAALLGIATDFLVAAIGSDSSGLAVPMGGAILASMLVVSLVLADRYRLLANNISLLRATDQLKVVAGISYCLLFGSLAWLVMGRSDSIGMIPDSILLYGFVAAIGIAGLTGLTAAVSRDR